MSFIVLKTDGGPHSAEKWAMATAELAVPIHEEMSIEKKQEAADLRHRVFAAILGHHDHVKANFSDHTEESIHAKGVDVVNDICGAARGTQWDNHYGSFEVVNALHELATRNLRTIVSDEIAWAKHRAAA